MNRIIIIFAAAIIAASFNVQAGWQEDQARTTQAAVARSLTYQNAAKGIRITCEMAEVDFDTAIERKLFTPTVVKAMYDMSEADARDFCNQGLNKARNSALNGPISNWRAVDKGGYVTVEGIVTVQADYIDAALQCDGVFAGTSVGIVNAGGTFSMNFLNTPANCSQVSLTNISFD